MNSEIHICTGANERFMIGATAAFVSIALSADSKTKLHFHIFTEGVEPASVEFMRSKLLQYHQETVLQQHVCDESLLAGMPYWAGSRLSAVRVLYPYLLKDIDWVMYVDCDLLYFASPEEHWRLRDDDAYVCVTKEEHAETRKIEVRWAYERCGVVIPDSEYFNAGVMLFNLKKCREDRMPDKIQQFYVDYPDVRLPDQTAMNVLFNGHKKMIPAKYDRLALCIDDEKLSEEPILHYVGGNPWSPKVGIVDNVRVKLWHRFCDKYLWGEEGVSYAKCFSVRTLLLKRILYFLLKPQTIGRVVARVLQCLRFTHNGNGWRTSQVGCDCTLNGIKMLMSSRIGHE